MRRLATALLIAVPLLLIAVPLPGARPASDGTVAPALPACPDPGIAAAPGPACRASPTSVWRAANLPRPSPGYHHLGAISTDPHTAVIGRLGVTDPGVRAGTLDFVATRFMARTDSGGATHWLEAGWAETGWSGGGTQRIYTFDTTRDSWAFYDQYPLHPGNRVWLHLESTGGGTWQAWLWWTDRWHLLATASLPATGGAQIEQYVEVHVDPARGGTVAVPPVPVDNVQIRPPGADLRFWRADQVRTASGTSAAGYCLSWQVAYDTWSAGDCTP